MSAARKCSHRVTFQAISATDDGMTSKERILGPSAYFFRFAAGFLVERRRGMNADMLAKQFVKRQCPSPGAPSLAWEAIFEALFAFYAEDRADGCDPADGKDRLLFGWGPVVIGGGVFFEVYI